MSTSVNLLDPSNVIEVIELWDKFNWESRGNDCKTISPHSVPCDRSKNESCLDLKLILFGVEQYDASK